MSNTSSQWLLKNLQTIILRRRFIIVNTAIVTVLAIALSLLLPKWYKSKSTILPPESSSPLSGLLGLSTGQIAQAVTNFALPLMATPSDLYASMLESETIMMRVVEKLKLQNVYDSRTPWEAVAELKEHFTVHVESDGIIVIEADAKDSTLAADIVNSFVAELDQFNRQIQNRKGRDFSNFLELRLKETDSALSVAAGELRAFQETHGAIALELQSEALIENLAKQKAELTSSEIELEMLKKTLYPDHPEVVRKAMIVREMQHKLDDIEMGAATGTDSTISALNIPLARIPGLTLKFAVLKRNVKIQELTFELLSQQYEMARLQERRDTPMIVVLDSAHPSELPAKPRKKIIVIVAFLLSIIGSSFFVILRENSSTAAALLPPALVTLKDSLKEIRHKPLG